MAHCPNRGVTVLRDGSHCHTVITPNAYRSGSAQVLTHQYVTRTAAGEYVEILDSTDIWVLRTWLAAYGPKAGRVARHLLGDTA